MVALSVRGVADTGLWYQRGCDNVSRKVMSPRSIIYEEKDSEYYITNQLEATMIYTRENKPIDVKTNDPGSDTNFGFFLGDGHLVTRG